MLENHVSIRILDVSDVSQNYIDWFNNADISFFSDNQYRKFTIEGQKKYVHNCLENNNADLYGIFFDSIHIGNLLISGLSSVHKRAEVAYVIGDKNYWNLGVASYAISAIIQISINKYKLNKLFAGIAHDNIGSKKVLEKNGFTLEGIRKSHLFYNNKFYDQLDYGLLIKRNQF
jgi:ribosomal-protein-alanine N-acetyltransferase